jgi:hypothetical protein
MNSNQILKINNGLTADTIDTSDKIVLKAFTSASKSTTFFSSDGGYYQVPVGKTLLVLAIITTYYTANITASEIGYGDTSVTDSATPPTNAVIGTTELLPIPTGIGSTFKKISLSIPATKYPFLSGGADFYRHSCILVGKLI